VIASPQAVSALDIRAGEEAMVAENASDFANQMLSLLGSPELRTAVGGAGRKFVERAHNWSTAAERLSEIYRQAIARRNVLN
jgi:glycosyltransferase involved in cell wall biosynthesis